MKNASNHARSLAKPERRVRISTLPDQPEETVMPHLSSNARLAPLLLRILAHIQGSSDP